MLPIDQVIAFARHEDPQVADLAMHCLEWVRLPQRLTGDFVLDAMRDQHEKLTRWLSYFPASAAVLDLAIDALVITSSAKHAFWPLTVIASAPEQLLTPERTDRFRWLKLRASSSTTMLRAKLANLSLSTEQLRDRLIELCQQADRDMSAMSEQYQIGAVADSLASRGDVDWATEKLDQFLGADNWMETWLFSILRSASHRPAFERGLRRFVDVNADENNALISELVSVIPDLCTPEDAERISPVWDCCADRSRSYLIEAVGRLRFPEAEPVLIRMIESSDDPFVKTLGAVGLCEMLCTSGEALRLIDHMVDREEYDSGTADLKELAVLLGIMIGMPFPKQAEWARQIRRKHARIGIGAGVLGWDEDDARTAAAQAATSYPSAPASRELLTRVKTVGRNDPCPCGSGKKYKKCCLGKA